MPRSVVLMGAALFIAGCSANQSREIMRVDSFPGKTLRSSPYEVTTYAWLRRISRADIHAIEALLAQHREIRKPIVRMWAVRDDRVQVITGRDEYRGDTYNCFPVLKRGEKWHIEESRIEDLRTTENRAELLCRGFSSNLTNR
jgi:hypothetical protein